MLIGRESVILSKHPCIKVYCVVCLFLCIINDVSCGYGPADYYAMLHCSKFRILLLVKQKNRPTLAA